MHTSGLIPLPVGARAKRIAASSIASTGTEYGWPEAEGAMLVTGVFSGVEFANGNAAGAAESWLPLSAGSVIPVSDSFVLRSVTGAAGTLWLGFYGESECPELAELGMIARMVAGNSAPQDPKTNPWPAATALNDTDANPTTTRIGANTLVWDIVDNFWVRWEARTPSDALPLRNIPEVISEGALFDSVNNVYVRARTIGSATPNGRAAVEDSYKNGTVTASMSAASTGIKLTYTCPTGKVGTTQGITIVTTSGSFTTGQWQILLNGNVISTLAVGAIMNGLNQGYGVVMVAGDVLTINCATAQASITAQGYIFVEERWAE